MIRGDRGITFVDLLIAIVLIGTSAMALATLINYLNQAMSRQQTKWTADRIAATVIETVSLPATMRATLSQTDNLETREVFIQLRGWKRGPHQGPWQGIRLSLPFVDKTSPTAFVVGGTVTGTPTYPTRYNLLGEACDMETTLCPPRAWPIEAITEYNFSCLPIFSTTYDSTRSGLAFADAIYPDGLRVPTRCIVKGQINVRVTVRESSDVDNPPLGLFKSRVEVISIPPALVFFPPSY